MTPITDKYYTNVKKPCFFFDWSKPMQPKTWHYFWFVQALILTTERWNVNVIWLEVKFTALLIFFKSQVWLCTRTRYEFTTKSKYLFPKDFSWDCWISFTGEFIIIKQEKCTKLKEALTQNLQCSGLTHVSISTRMPQYSLFYTLSESLVVVTPGVNSQLYYKTHHSPP